MGVSANDEIGISFNSSLEEFVIARIVMYNIYCLRRRYKLRFLEQVINCRSEFFDSNAELRTLKHSHVLPYDGFTDYQRKLACSPLIHDGAQTPAQ